MKRPAIHRTSFPSSKLLRVPLFSRCIDIGQYVQLALSVHEIEGRTYATLKTKSLLNSDSILIGEAEFADLQKLIADASAFFVK